MQKYEIFGNMYINQNMYLIQLSKTKTVF